MLTAEKIIEILRLEPLSIEGGFYREIYRSAVTIPGSLTKSLSTAIYYLLTPDTFSALHRLPSTEIFHHYLGGPVRMLQFHPDGKTSEHIIGKDIENGQSPMVIVPANTWQGAYLLDGSDFALLGTTVSPGFDFSDYEEAKRIDMAGKYPGMMSEIIRLTKPLPTA